MLTKCPECNLQISTSAYCCPHCGYPLKPNKMPYRPSKSHKRLPNGFGQISMIKSRNLRRPYRAMVSIGTAKNGHPICKTLGYYETYNDAYSALAEYHKNPYDLGNDITVAELYTKWSSEYYKTISKSSISRNTTVWNSYCQDLANIKLRDLRTRDVRMCVEQVESQNMAFRVRTLMNMMLKYAMA